MGNDRDWKAMEDGKPKYQAYLCSREWGLLREQVRERCGGICERCSVMPMDATHHLTYERQYGESLDDLQGTCDSCHKFTHGKTAFDPKENSTWLRYLLYCASTQRKCVCLEAMGYPRFKCGNSGYYMAMDILMREASYIDGMNVDGAIDSDLLTEVAAQIRDCLYCIGSVVNLRFAAAAWFAYGKPKVSPDFFALTLQLTGATAATLEDVTGPISYPEL